MLGTSYFKMIEENAEIIREYAKENLRKDKK